MHTLSHTKQDLVTTSQYQQDSQSSYNVTVGRVRAATVAVESIYYYTF